MSVRNFGSLVMVASCAGAALGCYLVSLRVASERAQLEDVETKIVLAHREMRVVQTEIGTRARLSQLERWNAKVLPLPIRSSAEASSSRGWPSRSIRSNSTRPWSWLRRLRPSPGNRRSANLRRMTQEAPLHPQCFTRQV